MFSKSAFMGKSVITVGAKKLPLVPIRSPPVAIVAPLARAAAVWLAGRGWDVTGVDFSKVGLDKARRVADQRGVSVKWERFDVTEYTPAPESFGEQLLEERSYARLCKMGLALTWPVALIGLGGCGVISVVSNELPGEMTQLTHLARTGDYAGARAMQRQIFELMVRGMRFA